MNILQQAIEICREVLVKPFEGYHKKLPNGDCKAYPDPGTGDKPWTIGWGTTGPHVQPGTVWTKERAQQELDRDLLKFLTGVLKLSPNLAQNPARRLSAVNSFCYNCGLGNYRISTFRKRVLAEDWVGAAEEILKWNKAAGRVLPGLTRRRLSEAALLK
jgi:lysozyme